MFKINVQHQIISGIIEAVKFIFRRKFFVSVILRYLKILFLKRICKRQWRTIFMTNFMTKFILSKQKYNDISYYYFNLKNFYKPCIFVI